MTALDRILRQLDLDDADLLSALAANLSGSDLTTLLLEVTRRRAARVRPADIVRQHAADRFTAIAEAPYAALRHVEEVAMQAAGKFEACVLSPLAPFGVHSAIATVDQNKVVSTIRGNEVAADPTNVLAVEAARRRVQLHKTSPETVRLAACQRVVRAQRFTGSRMYAHFLVMGLVSAGRDTGSGAFERAALIDHLQVHVETSLHLGATRVVIAVTELDEGRFADAIELARARFERTTRVTVQPDPSRTSGRGYYRGLCFKCHGEFAGRNLEIGDGGAVDWTEQLTSNAKERCFISGIGLERLAVELASDTVSGP